MDSCLIFRYIEGELILKRRIIPLLIYVGLFCSACALDVESTQEESMQTESVGASTEKEDFTENSMEQTTYSASLESTMEEAEETQPVSEETQFVSEETQSVSEEEEEMVETITETVVETEIIEEDLSEFHVLGSVLGVQDSIRQDLGVDWKDAYMMLAYAYSSHPSAGIAFFQNNEVDPICMIREEGTNAGEYAYHVYSYYGTTLYDLGMLGGTNIYRNSVERGLICTYSGGYTRWEYSDFNLIYYGTSDMLDGYGELEFMDITSLKSTNLSVDTIGNYVQ